MTFWRGLVFTLELDAFKLFATVGLPMMLLLIVCVPLETLIPKIEATATGIIRGRRHGTDRVVRYVNRAGAIRCDTRD